MKQKHVDKGQLGGVIQVITQSNSMLGMFTFAGTYMLIYDRYLREYISVYVGILIIFCGLLSYWTLYYTIIYPSIIQYGNRQAWLHNSPVKQNFELLNERLDKIEEMLEDKK